MKSGEKVAASGIARQTEEFGAIPPPGEFRELPADAASCSARQQDLFALAAEFLRAVAGGHDAAVELATALAGAVLDASGARLAQSVLDGGRLTVTRAIQLAEQVMSWRTAGGRAGAL